MTNSMRSSDSEDCETMPFHARPAAWGLCAPATARWALFLSMRIYNSDLSLNLTISEEQSRGAIKDREEQVQLRRGLT